ncbi:hypothetical protein Pelo_16775 [Pelomyxa schiedti]|nr:hypothetical protein Pelo_16775 [Pelomyxa schiedti]
MISCVERAVTSIFRVAHSVTNKTQGADELLPLFIHVLFQTDIPCVFEALYFMGSLSAPSERIERFGWCMATFEAAVLAINSTPSDS